MDDPPRGARDSRGGLPHAGARALHGGVPGPDRVPLHPPWARAGAEGDGRLRQGAGGREPRRDGLVPAGAQPLRHAHGAEGPMDPAQGSQGHVPAAPRDGRDRGRGGRLVDPGAVALGADAAGLRERLQARGAEHAGPEAPAPPTAQVDPHPRLAPPQGLAEHPRRPGPQAADHRVDRAAGRRALNNIDMLIMIMTIIIIIIIMIIIIIIITTIIKIITIIITIIFIVTSAAGRRALGGRGGPRPDQPPRGG